MSDTRETPSQAPAWSPKTHPIDAIRPDTTKEQIHEWVAQGASPNGERIGLGRPLHSAVESGNAEAIEALLEAGANPHLANRFGMTPLKLAISENKPLTIEALCAGRPETLTDPVHGKTPLLIEAAQLERGPCAIALLRAGANPNVAGADGDTALHHAARANNTELAMALMDCGATPFAMNSQGRKPSEVGSLAYPKTRDAIAFRAERPAERAMLDQAIAEREQAQGTRSPRARSI